jgi:flagellar biosynthesis protein FlhF
MEIKTYRAATMREALNLVRRELGPDAAVLHTREVRSGLLLGWLGGRRQIEVTASAEVNVPSRLPARHAPEHAAVGPQGLTCRQGASQRQAQDRPDRSREMEGQLRDLQSMVKELCRHSQRNHRHDLPEGLFRLFAELLDADLGEDLARELVERIRSEAPGTQWADPLLAKARIAQMIETDIRIAGPIAVTPGRRRLVALVGPTGVGKTTTIAKLAANYRLKEKRRVGLITVDTYRIAAVEQLRTYAEIIDLPMQVVSTPREIREAVRQMGELDLILMDTAGRSPRDEVRIQELKAFLSEAGADEVHLVLSAVASGRTLEQIAERFAVVGTTALVLTKLDEATTLGNVLPVLRSSKLPLSYLTDGQNVPDDIQTADAHRLARMVLAMENSSGRRR